MFDIVVSVQVALAVLLGGRGTIMGPVLGAFILEPLNEITNNEFWGGNERLIFFGGLLALVVLLPATRRDPERRRALGALARDRQAAALVGARIERPRRAFAGPPRAGPGRRRTGRPLLEVRGVGEAFRRPAGARRLRARGRGGDDHRPDRPERLRQDDALQRHRRDDVGRLRRGSASTASRSTACPRGSAPTGVSGGPSRSRGSSAR